MAKMSEKVSGGLGAAIQEVQAKINGEEISHPETEELLNSGVEAQKKRKRRTKAEMEAARQAEVEDNSLFDSFHLNEEPKPKNHEEFCELELKKAVEKGLENPDFDFRNFYEQGETVYYVNYSEKLGEKEVVKVFLRTIYPRMMVGSEEKSSCHCIGYQQRDNVFKDSRTANDFCNLLDISPRYTVKEPKLEEDIVASEQENS